MHPLTWHPCLVVLSVAGSALRQRTVHSSLEKGPTTVAAHVLLCLCKHNRLLALTLWQAQLRVGALAQGLCTPTHPAKHPIRVT